MVSISMIDIVTVVFQDELDVLKLQAQSIDLYCQDINLGKIIVVVNDDNLDVSEIDSTWWGKFSSHVVVVHRRVWNIEYDNNGWLTQQLCKILASAWVALSKWSMVLDAKTILVQPVIEEKIFDKDSRIMFGYYPMFPVFEAAGKIVSDLFQIDLQNIAGPAGIPFFFENAVVADMIKEVEHCSQQPFAYWFQQTGRVTEFILYSGYVQYIDGSLDKRFTGGLTYIPCNICHSESAIFETKFNLMCTDTNVVCVSIHRNAWTQLSLQQQQAYKNFLVSRGITHAKDLA
jgi:hypothetical protein